MAYFSKTSLARLDTLHPDLQKLLVAVIEHVDCTITYGHRGEKEQEQAFAAGKSKVHFPNSKHNSLPSLAVDVAPYPIDWRDTARFHRFAGFMLGMGASLGIRLRHGGDWDGDFDLKDQTFNDLVHFELVPKRRG